MYDGAGEGILTTIKCAREAFREEIAAFLLMFLRTLPTCLQHFYNHNKKKLKRRTSKSYKPEQIGNEIEEMDRYEQSDKLSKRIICEELTRERRYLKHIFSQAGGITSTDINLNSAPSTVAMKPSTEKSAQDRDLETIENESEWQTYPDISIPGFDSKITKLRSPLLTETIRLDCLMLFDDRLWTEIRVALNEIISMMLVSGEDVKKILGMFGQTNLS